MSFGMKPTRWRLQRFEFPKYWEQIIEEFQSPSEVLSRLKLLCTCDEPEEAEGTSFFLIDESENRMQVGCSGEGWVVMFFPRSGAARIAVGNDTAQGNKIFLLPEWTPVPRKHLLTIEVAENVVKEWMLNGSLSSEVSWGH
jgi:hypothetical protein